MGTPTARRVPRPLEIAATLLVMVLALTSLATVVAPSRAEAAMKNEPMTFSGFGGCGLLPCASGAPLDRAFADARQAAYATMRKYEKDSASLCAVRGESKHVDVYPGSSAPGYRWTLTTVCGKRADIGTKIRVEPIDLPPSERGIRLILEPNELRAVATYGRTVAQTLAGAICLQIPDDLGELKTLCIGAGGMLADWLTSSARSGADRGCRGVVEVTNRRVVRYLSCPM